jgi:hypothetical protein
LRKPFLAAMFFVIGFEAIAGNALPQAGVRSLTVSESVRTLLLLPANQDRYLREELSEWLDGSRAIPVGRRAEHFAYYRERAKQSAKDLGVLTAASLAIALFLFARREYESRPKE